MKNYSKAITHENTKQTEKLFGEAQVKNRAGGYVYEVTDMQRLTRFLILGADESFYSTERKTTIENAEIVLNLVKNDLTGIDAVNKIVEISESGRAAKNDSAIFALAIAASYGTDKVRSYALSNLNKVCRIATHLFQFIEEIQNMRGWGRALRKAVANWYTEKDEQRLGYQLLKYKNRNGWTHLDAIRLAHPKPSTLKQNEMFSALSKGFDNYKADKDDQFFVGMNFNEIVGTDEKKAANLIREYKLPREVIPTSMLNSPDIWDALVDGDMGMTALIRNLAKMTTVGYLSPFSSGTNKVVEMLSNPEKIRKSRIHPINVLAALLVYKNGKGYKGNNTWDPVSSIINSLEEAFYTSFFNVEPTNQRYLVSLDVSGSMYWGNIAGYEFLNPMLVSAAMAMITLRTEKNVELRAFSTKFTNPKITKNMSLDKVLAVINKMYFGRTDCSLPMIWATEKNIPVDTFIIWTDNETWAGNIHPSVALKKYRQKTGIDSKLIVCATEASKFTIADPKDRGMLDIAGFDSAVPQIIRSFSLGEF